MIVKLIGKPKSKACREIAKGTGIQKFLGKGKVDILINYGLAGLLLDKFYKKNPNAVDIPTINRRVGFSKYHVINQVKDKVPVPESRMDLNRLQAKSGEWLVKGFRSIGGKGIEQATTTAPPSGKYFQKFMSDRKYEVRVHAFLWDKVENWHVQKRIGKKDEIAWNYKNGGHFVTVNTPRDYNVYRKSMDIAYDVLNILGMSFGAVDLLVNKDFEVFFLEVNSAPGFSDLSRPIYVNAFNRLVKLPEKLLRGWAK